MNLFQYVNIAILVWMSCIQRVHSGHEVTDMEELQNVNNRNDASNELSQPDYKTHQLSDDIEQVNDITPQLSDAFIKYFKLHAQRSKMDKVKLNAEDSEISESLDSELQSMPENDSVPENDITDENEYDNGVDFIDPAGTELDEYLTQIAGKDIQQPENFSNTDEINELFNHPLTFGKDPIAVKNGLVKRNRRSLADVLSSKRMSYGGLSGLRRYLTSLFSSAQRRSIIDPLASNLIG